MAKESCIRSHATNSDRCWRSRLVYLITDRSGNSQVDPEPVASAARQHLPPTGSTPAYVCRALVAGPTHSPWDSVYAMFEKAKKKKKRWKDGEMGGWQMRGGGVITVTHVVSSGGSGVSSNDSWFHSEGRHAAERSDLHLWIFMLSARADFLPRFLWGARGVGWEGSTWWLMHTYMCTGVRERSQTHSDIHTRWICGEMGGMRGIRKGNESSLKWKVANVAKCKEVH